MLIAVGANDGPSFVDVVLRCAQAWVVRWGPPCSAGLAPQWPGRIAAMVPDVAAAVADVRTAMRGAGYPDGDYELVLQSYPAPLTERLAPELQDLSGCPFRTEDLAAREWITRLSVDFARLRDNDDDTGLWAVQESFHPNATGHEQIAGCVSEFLQMYAQASSCQPNTDGLLHTVRLPTASR
ncbi:MAG: hypothetical protein ACRDSL_00695 [Pseudonocardiaceae bacterium]